MDLGGRNTYFGPGTDLPKTIDAASGELRDSRLQDVAAAATIADHCPEIDFAAANALPRDVPINLAYVESFRTLVENTAKPIFFTAAGAEYLAFILQQAAAVAGGEDPLRQKPFTIHYAEPISPLGHSPGALQKLFLCADRGVPVTYTPGMLAGATGPTTLAGAVTVANAEALSGVVLHQLRAPGAPIVSGFGVAALDMATAAPVYGAPEYRLALSACADLYRSYGLPMWGTAGCSDANTLDEQAAVEAGLSLLTAALDGANLIHDVGYLGQGMVGAAAAIVMCAESIGWVKRFVRGFEVDPDHLDLADIQRVGPGGSFLSSPHTRRFHQQEHWRPLSANRLPLQRWQDAGAPTYGETVARKAREILKTHTPSPLSGSVGKALAEVCGQARTALAGRRFGT